FFVVVDGVEGKEYDAVAGPSLIFSPDSTRVAYMAGPRRKVSVVVDAEEGKPHESLVALLFSPDSKRLAYVALRGYRLVGHLGGGLDVGEGGKYHLVLDGVPGREYDFIGTVTFSPDSRHVACVAGRGGKRFVVVDGMEGQE